MGSFDDVLNWGIPALLIIIALGIVYIKFLRPYVIPLIQDAINYKKEKDGEREDNSQKYITYE